MQDLQQEYSTLKQQEQLLQTMSNAEKTAASVSVKSLADTE